MTAVLRAFCLPWMSMISRRAARPVQPTASVQKRRPTGARLRTAISAEGFTPYSQWWHFDGPGGGIERPILDVAVD